MEAIGVTKSRDIGSLVLALISAARGKLSHIVGPESCVCAPRFETESRQFVLTKVKHGRRVEAIRLAWTRRSRDETVLIRTMSSGGRSCLVL